jgi:hypothetical protein
MFERFASLTRFSHGWTITEKLDGTNACVLIVPVSDPQYATANAKGVDPATRLALIGDLAVFAQSRNKMITPADDNAGFARFVHDNAEAFVELLGEGRHYGEWVGKGINKRQYGLPDKRFALFNTARWTNVALPDRVTVVPVLAEGYLGEPGGEFSRIMDELRENGSAFAPGFMDPEGIVMRHGPSGTLFKKTFDYDEQGKWAENEARRAAASS